MITKEAIEAGCAAIDRPIHPDDVERILTAAFAAMPTEREIDGGRFEEWTLADFAGQCRMQARENLDPEYSQFMAALAARLFEFAAMHGPAVKVKPLLATRFKLAFNKAGNCTTFRRDQAERLEGEWVWLIEATNGMNDPVYSNHTNIEDNASVMQEIMSVSSVDHEEAHELLKSFTGTEGGTQQVDWYGLRDKIAAGISKAKYDQRQIDRRVLSALTPAPDLASENERLRAALAKLERYVAMSCFDQWLPEGHAKTSVLGTLLDYCRKELERT